jgi:ubiquinone/menaquinone biosynthesis C-methylase UbiE
MNNGLIEFLHSVATRPRIYDWIQMLVGQRQLLERVSQQTQGLHPGIVVDVGGGTGSMRALWPSECRYICLDIEMTKLKGFRSRAPAGLAVLSDATRMSVASASADIVMCKFMMHHLTDSMLTQMIEESLRVLRPNGMLILIDPILNRQRFAGRVLWRLDRGSYPRTEEELRKKLASRFKIVHWEKFAIYHEYVFGIGLRP